MGGSGKNGDGGDLEAGQTSRSQSGESQSRSNFSFALVSNTAEQFCWENAVEYFEKIELRGNVENWNEQQVTDIIRCRLTGDAFDFMLQRPELKNRLIKYKDFKKIFLQRFSKHRIPGQIYNEISNCRQTSGETVQSFANRLRHLKTDLLKEDREVENNFASKLILYQFKLGLRTEIKRYIRTQMDNTADLTFEDAVTLADREEMEICQQKFENLNIGYVRNNSIPNIKTCYICKKPNHLTKDCRNNQTCYVCKKPGHIAINCRARRSNINNNQRYPNSYTPNYSRNYYRNQHDRGSSTSNNFPNSSYRQGNTNVTRQFRTQPNNTYQRNYTPQNRNLNEQSLSRKPQHGRSQ